MKTWIWVFLLYFENRNFISKIRISKVTYYAALTHISLFKGLMRMKIIIQWLIGHKED